jgi:hypothetical protein
MVSRGGLASAELRVRLGALLRGLRPAVERRAERTAALERPQIRQLAITEQHAQLALADAEALSLTGRAYGPGTALADHDVAMLDHLAGEAAAAGVRLPGDVLRERGIADLDLEILLLACAPSIDPAFATLYAYVHDARSSGLATQHLAVEVLATGPDHERRVVEACGPFGLLRGEGWIVAEGPGRGALTVLRPADGVAELLWGATVDGGLLARRPVPRPGGAVPASVDAEHVASLANALADGRIDVVGVWGTDHGGRRTIVGALLGGRRAVCGHAEDAGLALQRAAIEGAVCVLDVPDDPDAAVELAGAIAASSVAVVLHGTEPLRAPEVILGRRFAELHVPTHRFADRRASWSTAFPQLDAGAVDDLAARFRLLPDEVEAVASLDRASHGWARNGHRVRLDALAGLVSRRHSSKLATIRSPARGPEMLVLPPAELAQVMDVAAAARAWPRVAEAWRLERFGNPGVTALFAGDPGTGKTLAAEVIAAEVGIDLMVVDVSRLVSKWIGETSKHLDAVFGEAEASSCVLFFDEADSLFGQRGEVTGGGAADRYANLEVGYLLQRLERYDGLVILASNLRENLDPAFTRRFHHVVHFPRPGQGERRRLWELALAEPLALAGPLDLDRLAALDLTGAAIAAIVRGAALAAHAEGRGALTAADLLTATGKQFRREARLLPRELLGPYAALAG